MEIPTAMALQLHLLSGDADRGDSFAAGLNRLGSDLTRVVPSMLAVSLRLVRLGYDVAVTAVAPNAGAARVSASLAVPLTAGEPGDALLLQAGDAGAFLLLADGLAGLAGAGYAPLEVDQHVTLAPTARGASLEFVLAELGVVNQAIGVLLDRGLAPEDALADLRRRAAATRTTTATVSRRLLADMPRPAETGPTEL